MTSNPEKIQLNFIGVGAAKSGTSWLSACLAEHPEVCMAQPKELNYFCRRAVWPEFGVNSHMDSEWLAERFPKRKGGQLLGEYSPVYLCDPDSPALIYGHNPGCRLLFLFRHPVDALYSYYQQIQRESPVPGTFEAFLEKYPDMRRMGLYHRHLQRFLDVFGRDHCWIRLFEDIQTDANEVLRDCYGFLGVSPDFVADSAARRVNRRMIPRSRLLVGVMNSARHFIGKNVSNPRLRGFLWKFQLHRLGEWLVRRNLKPVESVPIKEGTRKDLLDFYRKDTHALARLLGRDLSHWEY